MDKCIGANTSAIRQQAAHHLPASSCSTKAIQKKANLLTIKILEKFLEGKKSEKNGWTISRRRRKMTRQNQHQDQIEGHVPVVAKLCKWEVLLLLV